MFELILYDLGLSLKLLAVFLITLFILGVIFFFIIRKFDMRNGKIKIYGLFMSINNFEAFILSLHIVRVFLIMYYSIVISEDLRLTLSLIGIVSIAYIVFDMRNIIFETLNTISIMIAIYFINFLNTYLIEIEKSMSVELVKIALISFVLMYIIYYLLRNFENITTNNENILEE